MQNSFIFFKELKAAGDLFEKSNGKSANHSAPLPERVFKRGSDTPCDTPPDTPPDTPCDTPCDTPPDTPFIIREKGGK